VIGVLWGVGGLLVVGVCVLVVSRVRRLDRLHVRTDAARAGLEAACERRAVAATAVADVLAATPDGRERAAGLRAAAAAARAARATTGDLEAAENVLGRELASVPRSALPAALLDELVDAEELLMLARRVHNDAVRDTRELRSRRLVRWLHLAGTAPMPEYFEIVEALQRAGRPTGPGVTTAAPARPPVAPPP
jgi:hypothetical protein